MTIYFSNRDPLDLAALTTMGLSVKETSNPIGEFGTGLKYAVAILLRHGADLSFTIDGERLPATARTETFRGEPFQRPYIGETPLPITLQLGKGWELWQAYRELASNTRDETEGRVSDQPPTEAGTIIEVSLPAFDDIHHSNSIFLDSKPAGEITGVEYHNRPSSHFYYRGVRVWDSAQKPFTLTYNAMSGVTLTEDRTVKFQSDMEREVSYTVRHLSDPHLIDKILSRPDSMEFETATYGSTSSQFLHALEERRHDITLPPAWNRILEDELSRRRQTRFEPYEPSEYERQIIQAAIELLEPVGVPSTLELAYTLEFEKNVLAVYDSERDRITLSKACLTTPTRVARAIFEEFTHKITGFPDETRALENYLFDLIIEKLNSGEMK